MTTGADNAALLAQVADLQAQVRLMQSALSQMPQGVLVLGKDGRINYFNARVCEICNVTAEFLASKPLFREMKDMQQQRGDFGPDLALVEPSARAYVAGWGAATVDHTVPIRYTRQTREGRYIEVTSLPTPSGDYVRTFTDVTAREKAKLQSEQLAQQKGQFMALLSHELRTPLTTILGMNALLLDSTYFRQLTGPKPAAS